MSRQQSESRQKSRILTGQQKEPRKNNNRKSLGEQFRQIIGGKTIVHYTTAALQRKKAFIKIVHGV